MSENRLFEPPARVPTAFRQVLNSLTPSLALLHQWGGSFEDGLE